MRKFKAFVWVGIALLLGVYVIPLCSAGTGIVAADIEDAVNRYLNNATNNIDVHRVVLAQQTISDRNALALVRNHVTSGRYTDTILVLSQNAEGKLEVTGDVDKREFCFDQELRICARTE